MSGYTRQYKKHRKRSIKRSTKLIIAALVLVFIGSVLTIVATTTTPPPPIVAYSVPDVAETKPPVDIDEPTDHSSTVDGRWYGLCAKDRIRSIIDFRQAVATDALLAKHYAGFEWVNARIERLDEPAFVYVAYRKNQEIRYTTKRIRLPGGDKYITDGKRKVRFFCGNDFSATPPVSERIDSAAPQGRAQKQASILPIPEPATIFLIGSGLACLGLGGLFRRRQG